MSCARGSDPGSAWRSRGRRGPGTHRKTSGTFLDVISGNRPEAGMRCVSRGPAHRVPTWTTGTARSKTKQRHGVQLFLFLSLVAILICAINAYLVWCRSGGSTVGGLLFLIYFLSISYLFLHPFYCGVVGASISLVDFHAAPSCATSNTSATPSAKEEEEEEEGGGLSHSTLHSFDCGVVGVSVNTAWRLLAARSCATMCQCSGSVSLVQRPSLTQHQHSHH